MLIATIEAPHILILDEPTNHLDIESREALVLALNEYEGAVILVSHDTHLVETVADRLWLVKNGTVVPFEGDMDEYKKLIMAGNKSSGNKSSGNKAKQPNRDKKGKPASDPSAAMPVKKMNPVKLKSEISRLEKQMEKLGAKKQALEAEMMAADFYSAYNSTEIATKTKALGDITTELETVEESWLAMQEQI